jgi:hypothetical protein
MNYTSKPWSEFLGTEPYQWLLLNEDGTPALSGTNTGSSLKENVSWRIPSGFKYAPAVLLGGFWQIGEAGHTLNWSKFNRNGNARHPQDCTRTLYTYEDQFIFGRWTHPKIRLTPSTTVSLQDTYGNALGGAGQLGRVFRHDTMEEAVPAQYARTDSTGTFSYRVPLNKYKLGVVNGGYTHMTPTLTGSVNTDVSTALKLPNPTSFIFRNSNGHAIRDVETYLVDANFRATCEYVEKSAQNGYVTYRPPASVADGFYIVFDNRAAGPYSKGTTGNRITIPSPLLVSPADGATNLASRVTLSWQDVSYLPNHGGYLVAIIINGDIVYSDLVNGAGTALTLNFGPGTYDWVVAPYDTDGFIYEESYLRRFTVGGAARSLSAGDTGAEVSRSAVSGEGETRKASPEMLQQVKERIVRGADTNLKPATGLKRNPAMDAHAVSKVRSARSIVALAENDLPTSEKRANAMIRDEDCEGCGKE